MSRELYLDLLKKCILNLIYRDKPLYRYVPNVSEESNPDSFDESYREKGQDWPSVAHSMIGLKRMNNIQQSIETVLKEDVPGDFIETGVWRGGATIFMRGVLKAHNITDRKVWVADSFEGFPVTDGNKHAADADDWSGLNDVIGVSLEEVRKNFELYGLLDQQVDFLKGWFCDTLPSAPIERLALMRLDGDLYESTIDALSSLYPKLSPGGFCIIDDYDLSNCKKAVDDYRAEHGISEEIVEIDNCGVFWRKNNIYD